MSFKVCYFFLEICFMTPHVRYLCKNVMAGHKVNFSESFTLLDATSILTYILKDHCYSKLRTMLGISTHVFLPFLRVGACASNI